MKAAMTVGRNGPAKVSSHHLRQRPSVRRSMPSSADRRCTRSRRRPLLHRGGQRHHRGEIDLGAEKAQRWRRCPRAATVHRTAAAETLAGPVTQSGRNPARLAVEPRRMQCAAAFATADLPGGSCNVAIEVEQLLMEFGVVQQGLVQG